MLNNKKKSSVIVDITDDFLNLYLPKKIMLYYNKQSKELMNPSLDFVKKLHCPLNINLGALENTNKKQMHCSQCNHTVFDLDKHTETEIVKLLKENTVACVHFSSQNPNIKIL